MILKSLKIFSQNVQKNKPLIICILKTNKDFDILFIQEPPWSFVYIILSSSNKDRDRIVDAPNHPNWITFSRPLSHFIYQYASLLYVILFKKRHY